MHARHPRTDRRPSTDRLRARIAVAALALVLLFAAIAPASAGRPSRTAAADDDECEEKDVNMQCNDFGTIRMDSRTDVRGKPVTVVTDITLDTAYKDQGARWLMFSVRHIPESGSSPVTISLVRFETPHGEIITTEVERNGPNELNLWVDVLDTPVDIPITMEVEVGATERGAFSLETLVLAFDRGYEPIVHGGEEASLFSFTLLGVNKETRSTLSGKDKGLLDGKKTPGPAVPLVLALVAVTAAVLRRRNA